MMNFIKNIDKETVKTLTWYGLGTVGCYAFKILKKSFEENTKTNYSGTMEAIMNSSMLSSYKTNAVNLLRKDGDAEYYKAILKVLDSSMLSSDKIKTIEIISEVVTDEEETK